jgi:hypothetical protein
MVGIVESTIVGPIDPPSVNMGVGKVLDPGGEEDVDDGADVGMSTSSHPNDTSVGAR